MQGCIYAAELLDGLARWLFVSARRCDESESDGLVFVSREGAPKCSGAILNERRIGTTADSDERMK